MSGKVSTEKKLKYQEDSKRIKEIISSRNAKIKEYQLEAKKNEKFGNYYTIAAANEYLNIVNDHINLNSLSMELLNSKNESFLNDARKNYFNALIELEKVFGTIIDTELTENLPTLKTIRFFNPERKLKLIQKLGYTLEMIEHSYGANSKWKWSFVDMECRYISVLKNMINWKQVGQNNDPRMPFYEEQEILSQMTKELLMKAAERANEKYVISTHEIEDMKKAIAYLHSLRRIHSVFGDSVQAEEAKKKAKVWSNKIETDLKAKEKRALKEAQTKKKPGLFG